MEMFSYLLFAVSIIIVFGIVYMVGTAPIGKSKENNSLNNC
jgi:hypothetical protein